jgi:DNA-binding transcriptional LysR family regulator
VLDLKRLKVLAEVARCGSFSGAADAMDYSQPAISNNISRLELEVGARLLDRRRSGGVQLTEAGTVLLGHAHVLLEQMADAEEELSELIETSQRLVRLGAFATASATIVAQTVARFRNTKNVSFTLIEGESSEMFERLKSRQIDLALVFDDAAHPIADDELVELRYLYRDPMLIALPARHPLAKQEHVDITALAHEAWIEGAGRESPCSLILNGLCEEAGFDPRVSFNSGNYQVVLSLVGAGVGVALVPELAIPRSGVDPSVTLCRPKYEDVVRRIAVAVLRNRYRPPAAQAVLEEVERACSKWAARRPSLVTA